MELLQECVNLTEAYAPNLRFIRPDILATLQRVVNSSYSGAKDKKLTSDSKLQIIENPKNSAAVVQHIDNDIIGLILILGNNPDAKNKQFLAVVDEGPRSGKFEVHVDKVSFPGSDEFKEEVFSLLSKVDKTYDLRDVNSVGGRRLVHFDGISLAKIQKMMNTVFKLLKSDGSAVTVAVISRNAEDLKRGYARRQNAIGKYYTPSEIRQMDKKEQSSHLNSFRSDLENRLRTFKATKNPEIDTPEEMLQFIMKKGLLQDVRFGGVMYELYDTSIDIKKLMKYGSQLPPDNSWDQSYIIYQYADNNQRSYWEIRREVEKVFKDFVQAKGIDESALDKGIYSEGFAEYYSEFYSILRTEFPDFLAARRIKILFTMEKLQLVPKKFIVDDSHFPTPEEYSKKA